MKSGLRENRKLNSSLMSEIQSDTLTFKEAFEKADTLGRTALLLASWFFTGLMPKAPGTFGTLAAIPLAIAVNYLGTIYGAFSLVIFISVAVLTSGLSRKLIGREDPPEIVIDEAAGLSVTLFLLPLSWFSLSLGFLLFRLFDIFKPFPIRRLEKIKGGIGIVSDDLLAGVYANLVLRLVLLSSAG
jgi:phosphatidylglycerophosphatase A